MTTIDTTRRWPVISFRIVATGVATLVLLQAALAGSFLSGNFESLAAHARNGGMTTAALLLQTAVAALAWRMGSGAVQLMVASLAQTLVAAVLIPLGHHRILTVHVPLAVLLAIGVLIVAARSWRSESSEIR
ncbi:hypothetical protein [Nocardia sp. NPDC050793]|uniref:hypothetical protein n=1 Tax=Nocardia sp. NPDC050793 TaxID=3155159 RepID=UPI0033C10055